MGANPHANGGLLLRDLKMPDFRDHAVNVSSPGEIQECDTRILGMFLRDVSKMNQAERNFRIFGPDETLSNLLGAVFEVTNRQWDARATKQDDLPGAHSLAAYGSLATTGYGDTSTAFTLACVPQTLAHYARWLPRLLTPVVALNLLLPFLGGESARLRWLLASWILAYASFYSAYTITHETWWYRRFLLPAAPALVIGGLLVAGHWPGAFRHGRTRDIRRRPSPWPWPLLPPTWTTRLGTSILSPSETRSC